MASLRLLPLFSLPVLGGVLLAFVIATFEDRSPASQPEVLTDESVDREAETAVQETTQPVEEDEQPALEQSSEDAADPLAGIDYQDLVNVEDFNSFGSSFSPDISDILRDGFPASR